MVTTRQELTGIHQEKSGAFRPFPAKIHKRNDDYSLGNGRIHQEMVGIRQEMVGIRQELVGIYQEKSGDFRPEYCFHVPTFFRRFPAGTGPYFLTWVQIIPDLLGKHDGLRGSILGSSIDNRVPLTDEKL